MMNQYIRLSIIISLTLFTSVKLWAGNSSSVKETLGFLEGEYDMVSGERPCSEGYTGWMGEKFPETFMLGQFIIISGFNKVQSNEATKTKDECTFITDTQLTKNKVTRVKKVTCLSSRVVREDSLVVQGKKLTYNLSIILDGKLSKKVSCEFIKTK